MYVGKVKWYESFWLILTCFILASLTGYLSLFPALIFCILRIRKEIKRMIINKKNNLPLNHKLPYEEQISQKEEPILQKNVEISKSPKIVEQNSVDINYEYTKARKLVKDYTVLDFETTGLSAENDSIIQVAAVRYRDLEKTDEFVTFVNPLIPIPDFITKINGIKNVDVIDSPTIEKVLPKLINFIGDDVIIAHNATFDMKFLLAQMQINHIEYRKFRAIDTLPLSRRHIDFTKNHKLETLKSFLKLNHLSSHEALHDCYVAGELYKYCYEESLVEN
ncbi:MULTISPECIES: PolC-type DNA polymerase III [unclassified Sporosarcina]|uniref:3'-5' exonuclease n=1 Tax=unclassified Sporosarcina TaxID=2647733 RepID=UPI0013045FC3|nr:MULTISPECIES: exonuclease domain-containing protein [unclassified Sporosarcina]